MGKVLRRVVKGFGVVVLFVAAAIMAVVWDFRQVFEDKAGEFQKDSVFLSDTDNLTIVIHHTGNDERFSLREIEDFHRSQSWGRGCGFAYHYYVTDSAIYRLHIDTAKTNHAENGFFNRRSIAVCLAGNFEERRPTWKEVKNLLYTVVMLQIRYSIPRRRIFAHGEVSVEYTACCGKYLKEMLNEIKDRREER